MINLDNKMKEKQLKVKITIWNLVKQQAQIQIHNIVFCSN